MSKTYENGLDDAWKAAKRICLFSQNGGLDPDEMKAIFRTTDVNAIMGTYTVAEVIEKLAKQDMANFKVGDVVKNVDASSVFLGMRGVVTAISKNPSGCWIMWSNGKTEYCNSRDIEKTTISFRSISKILENLKYLEDIS